MVSFSKSSQEGSSRKVEEPTGRDDLSSQEGSSRNAVEEPTGRDDLSSQEGSSRNAVEEPNGRGDIKKCLGWSIHGEKSISFNNSQQRALSQNAISIMVDSGSNADRVHGFVSQRSQKSFDRFKAKDFHNIFVGKSRFTRTGHIFFMMMIASLSVHASIDDYCFEDNEGDDTLKSELYKMMNNVSPPRGYEVNQLPESCMFQRLDLLNSLIGDWKCEQTSGIAWLQPNEHGNVLLFAWRIVKKRCKQHMFPCYQCGKLFNWTNALPLLWKSKLVLLVPEGSFYWVIIPQLSGTTVLLEFVYMKFVRGARGPVKPFTYISLAIQNSQQPLAEAGQSSSPTSRTAMPEHSPTNNEGQHLDKRTRDGHEQLRESAQARSQERRQPRRKAGNWEAVTDTDHSDHASRQKTSTRSRKEEMFYNLKMKSFWTKDEHDKDLEPAPRLRGWIHENCKPKKSNGYFLITKQVEKFVVQPTSKAYREFLVNQRNVEVSVNAGDNDCWCGAERPESYYQTKLYLTNLQEGQRYDIEKIN